MTRQEAVVLSYLEWVRLINSGGIRLDDRRITLWSPEKSQPTEIVADLMLGAPDLGISANAFVLAMLEPEILDRVEENGIKLGKRLSLEMIRSFHSFTETARTVHSHDANAVGVKITLTPLAQGWLGWVECVESAERRTRGQKLLQMFSLSPSNLPDQSAAWLTTQEMRIDYEKIARWRDTMYYGWACTLNSVNSRPGIDLQLPPDVKEEISPLQKDYDVDKSFLVAAPRLCTFVGTLADKNESPLHLLALAAFKQHERYVAKCEGEALDIDSLHADIEFLKKKDIGAATMLARALGERIPSELIHAISTNMGIRGTPAENTSNTKQLSETGVQEEAPPVVDTKPSDVQVIDDVPPGGVSTVQSLTDGVNVGTNQGLETLHDKTTIGKASSTSPSKPLGTNKRTKKDEDNQPALFAPQVTDAAHASSGRSSSQRSSRLYKEKIYGKYARLYDHLLSLSSSSQPVELTFAEITKLLDGELPKSSKKASWWLDKKKKTSGNVG